MHTLCTLCTLCTLQTFLFPLLWIIGAKLAERQPLYGQLDGNAPFYDDDKASVKHRPLEDDAPKAIEPELQTNGKSPQLHADDAPKANDDAPKVPSWIIPDSENPYPY